jgi:hypothetical protein
LYLWLQKWNLIQALSNLARNILANALANALANIFANDLAKTPCNATQALEEARAAEKQKIETLAEQQEKFERAVRETKRKERSGGGRKAVRKTKRREK